jgi:hypothetical protein
MMAQDVTIQFVFPGEGCIIWGVHVTGDDPIDMTQMDQTPGMPTLRGKDA